MKYLIVLLVGLSTSYMCAASELCQTGLGGQEPFPRWLVEGCSSGASPALGQPDFACQFKDNANVNMVVSNFRMNSSESPLITHLVQVFAGGVLVESHPVSEILGILDTFYFGATANLTRHLNGTGVVTFGGTSAELNCGVVF